MKATISATVLLAFVAAFAAQSVGAQRTVDRAEVLQAAAEALGMARWSDIGAGNVVLPGIDVINTMEFQGRGTTESSGRALRTDYHVTLGYNPQAMRVEMTRTPDGGAEQHTIQTVREGYAWDESEIGAGLVPGKGTATPMMAAVQERLLELWTLPYGVIKAALAAGEKTTVSVQGGATVISFPLSGPLAGITVTATLDANNMVTKVDTRPDDPARVTLATQTEYSNYADRGEVLTDVKTPGRIIRTQGGRTILDIQVSVWESNGLYLVFPVPPNVQMAATATSR
jgi:hypothetical protein